MTLTDDAAHLPVLEEVAGERVRQIAAEGHTLDHDDEHDRGELALAGAAYALAAADHTVGAWSVWPWDQRSFKPNTGAGVGAVAIGRPAYALAADGVAIGQSTTTSPDWRRRCLIKAMALLCAEVERLDRKEAPHG